jgi:hypothetical protein
MAQTIEGTVTDSVTNQPLPGVKVAIDARGKAAGDALTDAQGAFRIEGLTPGEYTANFTRRGFQPPARDDASRRPFRLSTGNPVRLEARMTPLGKIGGRVLDATGAPVADANVQLFGGSLGYEETTDKQGKFSSDQVAPGSYVIWVHPPKNLKPPPARGGDRLAWAATFYPDGTDVTSAGKVQVRAGSEVWDLEVRLQPVPVHRLRGVVLDERGVPAPKVPVTLESNLALFGKPEDRETHAVSAEDGSFEFADASDGVWRLSAEADSSGTKLRAFTAETMAGHDLDRIQLRLSPPFAIHGSIVREAAAGVQIRKTPLLVLLTPEGGGSDFHQGRPDEEGLFAIAGIHPGRYVVRPIPPGPPFYLASMRLGDRELPLLEPIDLTSGALPLTIFYKSDGGGVRGTVENCGSATVIFFPQDPALQIPELERRATCGERGQFEIGAMRPGEYYGFAFDHAPGLDQMFFGFTLDRGLINQAARVTIRPGEFTTADLRVIPRP